MGVRAPYAGMLGDFSAAILQTRQAVLLWTVSGGLSIPTVHASIQEPAEQRAKRDEASRGNSKTGFNGSPNGDLVC